VRALPPLISVIVCAHNEEEYVDWCLQNLLKALENFPSEVIFVADRCTDSTVGRAKKYNIKIIEKTWRKWKNSYAESLQIGYLASRGVYIGIIDVDVMVPPTLFKDLIPMLKGSIASVAAYIVTYPNTLWNRVIYAWEKTYSLAPVGREPYGAARVILKSALDKIGGFRDIPTPDTDVDIHLVKEGYQSVEIPYVKVYHIRQISLRTMVNGQINCGRGRYALGIGLLRTVGHALFRFRPLIICGWLLEWQRA